jgi:hypothetical protein
LQLQILNLGDITDGPPTAGIHQEITMSTIEIKIQGNNRHTAPGKLAEAELHFSGGELDGLKLVGFAVWEARNGGSRYVSLPARQFAVNGDRRSFVLLRSIEDPKAQDRLRERVLRAYVAHASETANATTP